MLSVVYTMARPSVTRVDQSKTVEVRIMKLKTTLCPQKTCDYIFYNNFNDKCPIAIIVGIVSSQSTRHRKMVSFPTSPI